MEDLHACSLVHSFNKYLMRMVTLCLVVCSGLGSELNFLTAREVLLLTMHWFSKCDPQTNISIYWDCTRIAYSQHRVPLHQTY